MLFTAAFAFYAFFWYGSAVMNSQETKPSNDSGNQASQKPRSPVVVVMGHVDHGKTTLLDYLRSTSIAEREAGGITQSTAAYEVEKNGKTITFIDTPGHEAFTKMRQRGAQVADIAILIVAADDGVKPQTKEAIGILHETKIPFVVAINKIDKQNADVEKTKQDLLNNEVLLEKLGGDVPWAQISAKNGDGIDDLLDVVLLLWEMNQKTFNPNLSAKGFVLESRVDAKKGTVVWAVMKEGTLHVGDEVATASAEGKIKGMEDFLGKRITTAIPSSPVIILGFNDLPAVGEEFVAGELEPEERADITPSIPEQKETHLAEEEEEEDAHVILKADTSGSLEALAHVVRALSHDDMSLHIVSQGVGDITDGDIKAAQPTGALIVGFNVKANKAAESLARSQQISIVTSNIIYRIVEALEERLSSAAKKDDHGSLEVLATFSQQGRKQLVGGKVVSGILAVKQRFDLRRNDEVIGQGRIINIQQDKSDRRQVSEGECGILVETPESVAVGDILVGKNEEA